MKLTIISKLYGTQVINTESFNPMFVSSSSTIFKVVEHIFNTWYEYNTHPGAPLSKDLPGIYNGWADEPEVYTKKGAIRQGIQNLIETATEEKRKIVTTRDLMKMDIESAFL